MAWQAGVRHGAAHSRCFVGGGAGRQLGSRGAIRGRVCWHAAASGALVLAASRAVGAGGRVLAESLVVEKLHQRWPRRSGRLQQTVCAALSGSSARVDALQAGTQDTCLGRLCAASVDAEASPVTPSSPVPLSSNVSSSPLWPVAGQGLHAVEFAGVSRRGTRQWRCLTVCLSRARSHKM